MDEDLDKLLGELGEMYELPVRTQRGEIVDLIRNIPETETLAQNLSDILSRAQNPREHGGMADGSVSESVYTAALRTARALYELSRALDRLRKELRGNEPR